MKKVIASIFIALLVFAPLTTTLTASAAAINSCSPVTNLAQYSACCSGSASDSGTCKNFALANGGSGSTVANNCTNVSSLSQYSACCNGSGTDTNACKTFAATQASNASVVQQFNPSATVGAGNTYGGGALSISGVGGAIASCLNVGGFLVSQATQLLNSTSLGHKLANPSSFIPGTTSPVATSDTKAQQALADQNRTTQCLDGIAYAVAKNALAQITNKTLNWVNTGLNGNPLYVQNVGSYLGSIQNQQVTSFLGNVQNTDPIFGNALRSAITLQVTGKNDGLLLSPLNTPQAQSYNSFQSDFTNGGWDAFLNPANNPVGAFFNAVTTLTNNVATQQQQSQNEIQRNNGFLDMKHCVAYANNGQVSKVVTTPAQCSTISDDATYENCCTGQSSDDSVACQNYAVSDDGGDAQCANITDDTIYNNCCSTNSDDSAVCVAYNNSTAADANGVSQGTTKIVNVSTKPGAGVTSQPVCTQWSTTTPGSVIASQVQTVTNTPVQQLVYANKINEVLGNFFDSFVNNLFSKGLRGSGTTGQPIDLGFGSEGDNFLADTSAAGDNSAALGYQASSTGDGNTGDFDISRPQQLRAVLQTQENFLNSTEDAQVAVERIVPSIGALDYCIPGPNPDYQNGLDSNWQTFLGSIQQAPANAPTTLENIVGAIPVIGGLFSAFDNNSKPPPVWPANAVLVDKATSGNIQINRTFLTPDGKSNGVITADLESSLQQAYSDVVTQLSYNDSTTNTFADTPVGAAFLQASAGDSDPAYVNGFLSDAYTETNSLVGYNEAASTIDKQYDQNISDTKNTIQQMSDILNQVDILVGNAKARYIKENPDVNVQCLDQAYIINTTPVVGTARMEPSPLYAEEDAMVAHSFNSSNYFYKTQAN